MIPHEYSKDGSLEQLKAEIEASSPYNDGWTRQHYAKEVKTIQEQNAKYAKNLKERHNAEKKDYIVQLGEEDVRYLRSIKARSYAGMNDRVTCELFARMTEQILDTESKA